MKRRNKIRFYRQVYISQDTHESLIKLAKEKRMKLQDLTEELLVKQLTQIK